MSNQRNNNSNTRRVSKKEQLRNERARMSKKEKLKRRRKKKRAKMILLFIEVFVLLIAVLGASICLMPNSKAFLVKTLTGCAPGRAILSHLYEDDYKKNVYDDSVNPNNIRKVDLGDGYTNIALFGIDPRYGEFEDGTHTDTIMIVNINNKTHEVKLISVYRDSLLRMENSYGNITYEKANSAFFFNGAEGAINMLNENFDLDITEYALVNFSGLTKIIDALGGVDVNLTWDEMNLVNGYLTETREITGMDAPDINEYGENIHLNGLQATAYCRIRYVNFTDEFGNVYRDDYGRTARQRLVMNKILQKAQSAGVSELIKVADTLIKDNNVDGQKILSTNISWSRIVDLLTVAVDCNLTESFGFPYDVYTPDKIGGAYYGYVVPMGLEQNVKRLHQHIFPNLTYQPSSMISKINDYIIDETGVYPPDYDGSSSGSSYDDDRDYDNSDYNNSDYDDDYYYDDDDNDYYYD